MGAGSGPLLEARGIERRKPRGNGWLLRGVSLQLSAGDRLGITGPTGSGKTLLLRSLAMLDAIDSGKVSWRGNEVQPNGVPAYRCQVMYLHQRPALAEGSVEDCLRQPFALAIHGKARFDRQVACELLRVVDRDQEFLDKTCRDLSGGERQLVALVRAILLDPTVMLFDEPTAALDAATVELVERLVSQWFSEPKSKHAYIWVSHDPNQIRRMANRVLGMNAGKLDAEA